MLFFAVHFLYSLILSLFLFSDTTWASGAGIYVSVVRPRLCSFFLCFLPGEVLSWESGPSWEVLYFVRVVYGELDWVYMTLFDYLWWKK